MNNIHDADGLIVPVTCPNHGSACNTNFKSHCHRYVELCGAVDDRYVSRVPRLANGVPSASLINHNTFHDAGHSHEMRSLSYVAAEVAAHLKIKLLLMVHDIGNLEKHSLPDSLLIDTGIDVIFVRWRQIIGCP